MVSLITCQKLRRKTGLLKSAGRERKETLKDLVQKSKLNKSLSTASFVFVKILFLGSLGNQCVELQCMF